MSETATDVAHEFALRLKKDGGEDIDQAQALHFMARLIAAESSTPRDAMAFLSWAETLLPALFDFLPDDNAEAQPKFLAMVLQGLLRGAMHGLEVHTGTSTDTIGAEAHTVH